MHFVLLPGMDGTGDLFHRFREALPMDSGVSVVRYPEDKFLDWEDMVRHVEQYLPSREPFVIIAESFSGPTGMALAKTSPSLLRGLVLCCSFSSNPLPWGLRWITRLAHPKFFAKGLSAPVVRRYFVGADSSQALVEEVQVAISKVAPTVLAQRMKMVSDVDVYGQLEGIKVPLLYLAGQNDRLLGYRGYKQIKAALPGVRLTSIQGPHLLLQRRPEECVKAILDFIGKGES